MGLMETRTIWYDWEAELPSGLWPAQRKLRLRTYVAARGMENEKGMFVAQTVSAVLRHEVDPSDWKDGSRRDA